MLDVFTEEIEVLIKDGISNLYWYKGDLHKAWMRSGVPTYVCQEVSSLSDPEGKSLTKRKQMDILYERLRDDLFERRLEVSRNLVRTLIEHENFAPQSERHRIDIAERCALKLREAVRKQEGERDYRDQIRRRAAKAKQESYHSQMLRLRERFCEAMNLKPQERGYEFEKIVAELMRISGIQVEEPFRIEGEQIDGAIKYDGHYYLLELKWTEAKMAAKEIGSFHYKVDGKLEARGIAISMSGFSDGVIQSLPRGKELKILLFNGVHFSNVLFGHYTVQELLEHAISQATLKGELYCATDLGRT